MDNAVLYALMKEVGLQCRLAFFAFQNMRANLYSNDPERLFFYVHAFLSHVLQISELCWPSRPDSKSRGESLRSLLELSEASPLYLAGVRHALERPDEQLEDWLAIPEHRQAMEMNVMAQGTLSGFSQDTFQRNLDPESMKLTLRGTVCDLRRCFEELKRLETTLKSWFKTHHPW